MNYFVNISNRNLTSPLAISFARIHSTYDFLKCEISLLVINDTSRPDPQLIKKEQGKELHLQLGEKFSELKRNYSEMADKSSIPEAIAMDI